MTLARFGLDIRMLGKTEMREFIRLIGINIYDELVERFDSPLLKGALSVDAVLGTLWGAHRGLEGHKRRIHAFGNAVLTRWSNFMTGYRVSDMECCYKILPLPILRRNVI